MRTLDLHAVPPLGEVPELMKAVVIRKEREGEPLQSMQVEDVPVPVCGDHEVLVLVMAAGVNFNGVWAGQGKPVSVFKMHEEPFHIAGSDAAGIVWKVGRDVRRWKVGDEVVIHCNMSCGQCPECNGLDPMACSEQKYGATRRRTAASRSSRACKRSSSCRSRRSSRGPRRRATA